MQIGTSKFKKSQDRDDIKKVKREQKERANIYWKKEESQGVHTIHTWKTT